MFIIRLDFGVSDVRYVNGEIIQILNKIASYLMMCSNSQLEDSQGGRQTKP